MCCMLIFPVVCLVMHVYSYSRMRGFIERVVTVAYPTIHACPAAPVIGQGAIG